MRALLREYGFVLAVMAVSWTVMGAAIAAEWLVICYARSAM